MGALALKNSQDYDLVKNTMLQAYELVSEAYGQKFRNLRKASAKTYVEFARDKKIYMINGMLPLKLLILLH